MSQLRITLFGKFSMWQRDEKLDIIEARKLQELLCYLLVFRDHSFTRESLAGLFWGDCSIAQSKKYLRQALWQLQSIINPILEKESKSFLISESDRIQLNPQADFWLDVAEFENAYDLVMGQSGKRLDIQQFELLQKHVGFYQGDLMEGCYQDWCLFERERLQNMYLEMLDKLMEYCEEHHEIENGLIYGTLILRLDRACERTYRRLMRLYYLDGNRSEALRQYQRCEAALQEELSVLPSNRTKQLLKQIQMDQLDKSIDSHSINSPATNLRAITLIKVVDHLKQMTGMYAEFQRKVQEEIQTLEHIMKDIL